MIAIDNGNNQRRNGRAVINYERTIILVIFFEGGVRGIFLHGFMSFAAVCVTVACLIIIGSFSMLLYNLNIMVAEVEQDAEILVYIDENYTEAEAKSVGSKMDMIENVHQATFVQPAAGSGGVCGQTREMKLFQGIQADVFGDRFIVTLGGQQPDEGNGSAIEAGRCGQGECAVPGGGGLCHRSATSRIVSAAVIILLLVVFFIISIQSKLAMYDRRDEIAIMKMVRRHQCLHPVPLRGGRLPLGYVWRGYGILPGVGLVQCSG